MAFNGYNRIGHLLELSPIGTGLLSGLPTDARLDDDAEVQHFKAQIFSEVASEKEVLE